MPLDIDWRGRVPEIALKHNWWAPVLVWFVGAVAYVFILPKIVPQEKWILYCPSPKDFLFALGKLDDNFLWHALNTLCHAFLGFAVGSVSGVAVAFVMFRNRIFHDAAYSVIEALRPLPPVALTVFVSLWFGANWIGWLTLISLGCFMVLVVGTYEAVRGLDVNIIRAAKCLGATGWAYWIGVLLPASVPSIAAPLRVSLALAFAVTISAEFMGVQNSLGQDIMTAKSQLDTRTIIIALAVLTVEAAFLDWLLRNAIDLFRGRRTFMGSITSKIRRRFQHGERGPPNANVQNDRSPLRSESPSMK